MSNGKAREQLVFSSPLRPPGVVQWKRTGHHIRMHTPKIEIGHVFPNLDEHFGHFHRLRVVLVGELSCRPLECRRPLAHGTKEGVQVVEIFRKRFKLVVEIFRKRFKLRKVRVHLRPLLRVFWLAKKSDIRKATGWWNAGIFEAPIEIKFKKTKDPRLVFLHGFSHIELVVDLRYIPFNGTKHRIHPFVHLLLVGVQLLLGSALLVVVCCRR